MFTNKTCLIIPTKNRSEKIIQLLSRLRDLNLSFSELIIVDSSNNFHSNKVSSECEIRNIKYYKTKSSTSFQRNFGMNKMNKNVKYVMFHLSPTIMISILST